MRAKGINNYQEWLLKSAPKTWNKWASVIDSFHPYRLFKGITVQPLADFQQGKLPVSVTFNDDVIVTNDTAKAGDDANQYVCLVQILDNSISSPSCGISVAVVSRALLQKKREFEYCDPQLDPVNCLFVLNVDFNLSGRLVIEIDGRGVSPSIRRKQVMKRSSANMLLAFAEQFGGQVEVISDVIHPATVSFYATSLGQRKEYLSQFEDSEYGLTLSNTIGALLPHHASGLNPPLRLSDELIASLDAKPKGLGCASSLFVKASKQRASSSAKVAAEVVAEPAVCCGAGGGAGAGAC